MGRIKTLNKGKFVLRTDKANAKSQYQIYIQYTVDRKVAKRATGIWVKESEWNEATEQVRASNQLHSRLNAQLRKLKTDIDAQLLDFDSTKKRLTIEILRQIVKGELSADKADFVDFVELALEDLETQYKLGKIGVSVRENGKCTIKKFRQFLLSAIGESQIDCAEVTEDLIDRYIIWRKDILGNTNETINKALTPLIKACRVAVRRGLMKSGVADAIAVKYLAPSKPQLDDEDERGDINYLTEEQLREFAALYDKVKYPRTRDFMDMFLFSVHACGLRVSDIITLQWSNIEFKTRTLKKILVKGNKEHKIALNDGAITILSKWKGRYDRFVFGLLPNDFDLSDADMVHKMRLNKNRTIQQSLMVIGEKLKLPFSLKFHCARHTFAVLALNKGVDVHKVSTLMAHSSIGVTEKVYAKFLPSNLENEVLTKLNFNF